MCKKFSLNVIAFPPKSSRTLVVVNMACVDKMSNNVIKNYTSTAECVQRKVLGRKESLYLSSDNGDVLKVCTQVND